MNLVKTQIEFEAAHRLYDVATYTEACRENVHGHSYKVLVTIGRDNLNAAGMVMDFKQLKEIVNNCITTPYDHSCILKSTDPLAGPVKENCKKVHIVEDNPTAEWMCIEFVKIINAELQKVDSEIYVDELAVQETTNNIAIYRRDESKVI